MTTTQNLILFQNFHYMTELWGKSLILFGADMCLSVYIDNKGKDIMILVEVLTQRLDDTILTAEAIYPIIFFTTK